MPLATCYALPAVPQMKMASPHAGLKFTVVIESAVVLLDVKDTLRDLGVGTTLTTTSPAEALVFLRNHKFDVAILGVRENSPSVRTLIAEMERLEVPVILIEDSGVVGQAAITVPFNTTTISDAIDRALGRL